MNPPAVALGTISNSNTLRVILKIGFTLLFALRVAQKYLGVSNSNELLLVTKEGDMNCEFQLFEDAVNVIEHTPVLGIQRAVTAISFCKEKQ